PGVASRRPSRVRPPAPPPRRASSLAGVGACELLGLEALEAVEYLQRFGAQLAVDQLVVGARELAPAKVHPRVASLPALPPARPAGARAGPPGAGPRAAARPRAGPPGRTTGGGGPRSGRPRAAAAGARHDRSGAHETVRGTRARGCGDAATDRARRRPDRDQP